MPWYFVTLLPSAPNTRCRILHLTLRGLGQFADIALVHPEGPLGFWHHDFRVRKHWLVVWTDQTVDVVAMEMRDDHDIDVIRVDPCGLQVRLILAERTLGLRVGAKTEAGVDGDEFRSGIDDGRRIGVDDLVLWQELRLKILGNCILGRVDDIAVPERVAALPIGDDGDFEFANLIAVPSGILFARDGRSSVCRRNYCL